MKIASWADSWNIEGDNKETGRQALRLYRGDQWDPYDREQRRRKRRPALTINITKAIVDPIVASVIKNIPRASASLSISGISNQERDIVNGILEHVDKDSGAFSIYKDAILDLAVCGEGYWRVVVDEIDGHLYPRIAPVPGWESCIVVRNARMDRSDSLEAFINTSMPVARAEAIFKKAGRSIETFSNMPWLGFSGPQPLDPGMVGVTEYWSRSEDGIVRRSYLLDGDSTEYDPIVWPGKMIPIVMLTADESWIDGRWKRYGLLHGLEDMQRIVNIDYSAAAESIMQQTSTPYIAAAASVDPYKSAWTNMATDPQAVLLYEHRDPIQGLIPPPQKIPPSNAHLTNLSVSLVDFMQKIAGTEDAIGADSGYGLGPVNNQVPVGGAKIVAAVEAAITHTGNIIIDLVSALSKDGHPIWSRSPSGRLAEVLLSDDENEPPEQGNGNGTFLRRKILGSFKATADIAPNQELQAQRTFDLLSDIVKSSPPLGAVLNDLLFQSANLPVSDEIARRLRMQMNPKFFDGPEKTQAMLGLADKTIKEQQDQIDLYLKENERLRKEIENQKITIKSQLIKAEAETAQVNVKEENAAYRSETQRLEALLPVILSSPEGQAILKPFIQQLIMTLIQEKPTDAGQLQP